MRTLLTGFALFCGIASANTIVCPIGTGSVYSGSGICTENGFTVNYQMSSLGVNLADLIVTPHTSGGIRGFDITSDGNPLTGDYVFTFSMTPLGSAKITSFTESTGGTGVGITDIGYACDAHNSCNYFNLHSSGTNSVTYNYSPASVNFLSHEDVGVIKGGSYGFVDKSITVTPEPGPVALIGTGLLALASLKFRKRAV